MIATPILLITFNRPDHVRRVLTEILKQGPQSLYVCQDGPRDGNENDRIKCQEVRDVINELTSRYAAENKIFTLHTLYQQQNLGCGRGPYEAMSWFFQNVEYGIILEDDIFPHPLFWSYMTTLLERYKDDNRVGMVTAHNLQRYYSKSNSYYFTHEMAGTLGWGTWRRVWMDFDFHIPYNKKELKSALQKYRLPLLYINRECALYEKWLSGTRSDCWDYQFDYYLLVNNYLNARANSCLTSHEGDDADATHTGYFNPGYKMDVHTERFIPITHPRHIQIDSGVRFRMFKKEIHLILNKLIRK